MKKLIIIIGMMSLVACDCVDIDKDYREYIGWCNEETIFVELEHIYCLGGDTIKIVKVFECLEDFIASEDADRHLGVYPLDVVLMEFGTKKKQNPTFDKFMKWRNEQ